MNSYANILCFTSSLNGGGAEKHLVRVINHLNREQFQPSLALTRTGGVFESDLARDVPLHHLSTGNPASSSLRMIQSIKPLRQLIQTLRPDILYSVMDYANLATLIATRNLTNRPKIVLGVQNTPSMAYMEQLGLYGRLILLLMARLYPQADQIVALSKGVSEDLMHFVPKINDRIEVIYNAGFDVDLLQKARVTPAEKRDVNEPIIVAVGSLTKQKGFSYLIDAFKLVRATTPAQLWILGEGHLRSELENQIGRLGLTQSVRLLGFKRNPYSYMAVADVFVLSSLWEGFGNVIVEAMATGTAVIATNCPHGPNEIIEHEVNGLLVPRADPQALSGAIIRLLNNQNLKHTLAQNGRKRSEDFNVQNITSTYGEMFMRVLANGA